MDNLWIDYFLKQPENRFLCRVDNNFIQSKASKIKDQFPFTHLPEALEFLLNGRTEISNNIMEEAKILYGLIHAQYLMTEAGQEQMLAKFHNHDFEKCPRTLCKNCQCLPFGSKSIYGKSKLQLFCPNCTDSYNIPGNDNRTLDGSFFGPDWFHFLLQKHPEDPELFPPEPPAPFVPKIYGFKVYNPSLHPVSS